MLCAIRCKASSRAGSSSSGEHTDAPPLRLALLAVSAPPACSASCAASGWGVTRTAASPCPLTNAWGRQERAGNKTVSKKELRNVGPSISYKLRDAAGQAREFHNYMLPVDMGDGGSVFLLGVRETPAAPFRYLRVPVDDQGSMQGFVQLRAALNDPALRERAVRNYVGRAVDGTRKELAEQLTLSA